MGIVNVTPDSFSDGGRYLDAGAAIAHGLALAAEGAALVDIGGESTRPGAEPVAEAEELRRVIPVVAGLRDAGLSAAISIDTSKVAVARAALDAGATLVNDVTAFRDEPELAALVAERGADCCLMHMRGEPRTMQSAPLYDDVVGEVLAFLDRCRHRTRADPDRSRDRLRQDRRAQPGVARAARRADGARAADPDRSVAQVVSREDHRQNDR
jgi:dihydropteroate synthase